MIGRFWRSLLAACLAVSTVFGPVAPASAQEPSQAPKQEVATPAVPQTSSRTIQVSDHDYTNGKPWFPHIIGPYKPTVVEEPNLVNSPKIEQMIQDGKLRISLQDAVDLALQNNLDIAIQRYGPWIAEANVLRTLGGGISRGSFTALGNIPAQNFDPIITSTLSLDQRATPVNNPLTAGTGTAGTGTVVATNSPLFSVLRTHAFVANFLYSQGLHTGTAFSVGFNNTRLSTSSAASVFSPSVNSSLVLILNQQLLNGFGRAANERYIRIAKLNKTFADDVLQQQVITSITAVGNAYWELAFARGNLDVSLHQIELANKLYSDNKKQVDIGTLAPLEIVQAEAQVATANQNSIVAQTTLLQDQLTLLNLISKDPTAPALRGIEIIPTDTADTPPPDVEKIPLEDAIKEAVTKRPDVLESDTTLKADEVNIAATRNALLPVLNLSGEYASASLAGNNRPTCAPQPCTLPPQVDSGFFTGLGDLFTGAYPEYNAQLTLTLPIRNRQAQGDNVTALLTTRQDAARRRQIVNNVAIDVHNAQIVLEQSRSSVDAAAKTRQLDQETLDAEQKKYQLGASTLFNIVSFQNSLASAASAEVRARMNLAEAKVNFDRAMGRTLEVFNITIASSKSGQPAKDTLIPGTSATGELIADPKNSIAPNPAVTHVGSSQ